MKTLKEIKGILARNRERLKSDFLVKEMGIFGAYAGGKKRKTSDIDMLVQFEKPIGLFKFLDLEDRLSSLLGMKVEVVTGEARKLHTGERILRGISYL